MYNSARYENYIIEDIKVLGRSETRKEFDEAYVKFEDKQKQKNYDDIDIDAFLDDFKKLGYNLMNQIVKTTNKPTTQNN